MRNKFVYAFLMAGFMATFAGAAITPTAEASFSKDDSGCYKIGNAADLYGFAQIVGTTAESGNKTACGKLTANIAVNAQVHNSDGELINKAENSTEVNVALESWTPMAGFRGIFDGQGFTISGLYTSLDADAGFFSKVYGGAIIKDLNIRDSYIRANNRAGGIFADLQKMWDGDGFEEINAKFVVVESCSFGGSVTGGTGSTETTAGQNLGGLVGTVSPGMNLTIANSYNEGRVLAAKDAEVKAGVASVGRTDNYSKNATGMELVTGYHIGGLVGNIQPGAIVNVLNCYNTGTVDDKTGTPISATIAYNNEQDAAAAKDNVNCLSGGKNCKDGLSKEDLLDAFNNYNKKKVLAYYDASALNTLFGFVGVTFSKADDKLVATLNDDEGSLVIPQDVQVDSVHLNRQFSIGVMSTVVLPFQIAKANVSGTSFYNVEMVQNAGTGEWQANADEIEGQNVLAHKPYMLIPEANGALSFNGPVTLVATPANSNEIVNDADKGWVLKGTYIDILWKNESSRPYAYGFSANIQENIDLGYSAGTFTKFGTRTKTRPMRAYLLFSAPAVSPKPGVGLKTVSTINPDFDLPESVDVYVVEKKETMKVVGKIYIKPVESGVARWHDVKGRSLGQAKPNVKGAYLKNGKPVLVK